jgi:hypothetical protein
MIASKQMWHNTQHQTIGKPALTVLLYSYTLCSILEIIEKKYSNYIKDAEFCKADDDL